MNRASGSVIVDPELPPASGSSPTALKSRVSVGNWVPTPSRSVHGWLRQRMLLGVAGRAGRGVWVGDDEQCLEREASSEVGAVEADLDGEVEGFTHRQIESCCHDLRVGVVRAWPSRARPGRCRSRGGTPPSRLCRSTETGAASSRAVW